MKNFVSKLFGGLILVFLLIPIAVYCQQNPLKGIDSYIEEVCRKFEVPGIAVAVVKDGNVVLSKGYGIKKLGALEKIDENTLFGIASNSKAFTATALAILVEEGKVKWDTPVKEYLPWFQMPDYYISGEITVRDLLVHWSGLGLGAGDLLWFPSTDFSRKEICERLKHLPLKTSFRSSYAYDNVLYIAAGQIIEAVSGMSWEDFITKRILEKIGMKETKTRPADAAKNSNTAAPHAFVDGKLKTVAPFLCDNSNPAGGISSCAFDMAKWLIVQLDSGRIREDEKLFSPAATKQLWQYVTPIPISKYKGEMSSLQPNFFGYALGFQVKDYSGHKIVTHTGAYPGYLSQLVMIPDMKLGVVVLTNQESGYAFNSISYKILDVYLNNKDKNWMQIFANYAAEKDAANDDEEKELKEKRKTDTKPSLPLDSYTGAYSDKWYGEISIQKKTANMKLAFQEHLR